MPGKKYVGRRTLVMNRDALNGSSDAFRAAADIVSAESGRSSFKRVYQG